MKQPDDEVVDLQDLDGEAGGEQGLEEQLEELVGLVVNHVGDFTDDQVEDMLVVLQERGVQGVEYDSGFDLYSFINKQVRQLELMRIRLMSQKGDIRVTASSRDLKDLMNSGKTLTDTVIKHQKQILDFKRIQKIESATRTALEEVDPDLVQKFVDALEELLEDVEE